MENYGYRVIDLGKNVPPEEVVSKAKEHGVRLIGLSALMTTTVKSMQETIALIKREMPYAKVMVGGAVLTADYAKEIGADFYARDAREASEIAKTVFE